MDQRKIRLYRLQKQNLIEKAPLESYQNVLREQIALHSTDYLTPYLSLWARVHNFDPLKLFEDINTRKTAIRLRAVRGTVFVIHRDSLETIAGAARIFMGAALRAAENMAGKTGLNLTEGSRRVRGILSGGRILSTAQIKKELPDIPSQLFVLIQRKMEFDCLLARAPQRHLTDQAIRYCLMEEWISDFDPESLDPEAMLRELALSYIHTFGPVRAEDLRWWLPLNKSGTRKLLEALEEDLVHLNIEGKEYVMEAEDNREFQAFTPEGFQGPLIHFLPYEDHFAKAYVDRDFYLAEEAAPLVYEKGPIWQGQIMPSIWLDGQIIGRWNMSWTGDKRTAMKVETSSFLSPAGAPADLESLIEERRRTLQSFINGHLVPLMNKK